MLREPAASLESSSNLILARAWGRSLAGSKETRGACDSFTLNSRPGFSYFKTEEMVNQSGELTSSFPEKPSNSSELPYLLSGASPERNLPGGHIPSGTATGDAPCGRLHSSGPSGNDSSKPFASAFTRPSHRRFVEWVTALALNVEEHTITQSVTAIERVADWKALESFAEYGVWKPEIRHQQPARNSSTRLPAASGTATGSRPSMTPRSIASGEHVWGTCTFHEYTARCPNRATTVRAHNWVVLGALLQNDGQPAWYPADLRAALLPQVATALPAPASPGPRRRSAPSASWPSSCSGSRPGSADGPHLGVFDGGYALKNVVRPLVMPEEGLPRIEFLTRLRHDARLYALPPTKRPKGKRGRTPEVGQEAVPAPPGGPLARGLAEGRGLHLRPDAEGPLEGGRLPVAGARP